MAFQTRLFALIAGALLAVPALPQHPARDGNAEPTVLFVCEHGAAKSIIAAAHFNDLAEKRGLQARAIARGTNPDPVVSPKAAAGLRSEGLAVSPQKPQIASDSDVSSAIRVVTLGCKLPQKVTATDWNDIPSVSENYPAASRVLRTHVEALVDELSAAERRSSKKR